MATINVNARINAKIDKVWDYYTNAAHIVNWNFADPSWHCPTASNDLKVGGIYTTRMEAKDGSFGFDFKVVYTDIDLGTSFTYKMEDGRQATVTLTEKPDNSTEISIVFDAEEENAIDLQKNGWQAILNNFKVYTEKK